MIKKSEAGQKPLHFHSIPRWPGICPFKNKQTLYKVLLDFCRQHQTLNRVVSLLFGNKLLKATRKRYYMWIMLNNTDTYINLFSHPRTVTSLFCTSCSGAVSFCTYWVDAAVKDWTGLLSEWKALMRWLKGTVTW